MVTAIEILPILLMAFAIVFIPLMSNSEPGP